MWLTVSATRWKGRAEMMQKTKQPAPVSLEPPPPRSCFAGESSVPRIVSISIRSFWCRLPGCAFPCVPMGSQWLKIQGCSFASEFKNTGPKVSGCAINHVINGGWAQGPRMHGYNIVFAGRLMAPFWGPRRWLGPEGALWRCPIARAWLTALMKPAVVGMRDCSGECTVLQSARVTSKEFWFLSSGEGVKSTPLWETGSLSSAFEYFSVYRMSVLGVGDTEKRELQGGGSGGGCGEFFISKSGAGGRTPLG